MPTKGGERNFSEIVWIQHPFENVEQLNHIFSLHLFLPICRQKCGSSGLSSILVRPTPKFTLSGLLVSSPCLRSGNPSYGLSW